MKGTSTFSLSVVPTEPSVAFRTILVLLFGEICIGVALGCVLPSSPESHDVWVIAEGVSGVATQLRGCPARC